MVLHRDTTNGLDEDVEPVPVPMPIPDLEADADPVIVNAGTRISEHVALGDSFSWWHNLWPYRPLVGDAAEVNININVYINNADPTYMVLPEFNDETPDLIPDLVQT